MAEYSKLKARILTALVGCPIIIAAVYFGGTPFLIIITMLAILCITEFLNLAFELNTKNHRYDLVVYLLSSALIGSAYMQETRWIWSVVFVQVLAIVFIIYFLAELFFERIYIKGDVISGNFRAVAYIGFFLPFFILIRELPLHGLGYTIFLIFTIWVNDTAAYFIGKQFGKHKLNLKLSPKKSVEGSWGGFFAAILFAYLFGSYLGFTTVQAVIIGAVLSLLAQGGDLLESLFKRQANSKDSGSVLPGHGGFLDRMDSFILAGPVYYFLIIHFIK